MPAPAVVAIRDLLCAIARDNPLVMDSEQIHDLVITHSRWRTSVPEIYQHCQALHVHGYLQKFPPVPAQDWPTRWMWIPADLAPGHRRIELHEADQFAALAQLAGDPGPTR